MLPFEARLPFGTRLVEAPKRKVLTSKIISCSPRALFSDIALGKEFRRLVKREVEPKATASITLIKMN